MSNSNGPTQNFWNAAGFALVIFALLVGMGACGALWNHHP